MRPFEVAGLTALGLVLLAFAMLALGSWCHAGEPPEGDAVPPRSVTRSGEMGRTDPALAFSLTRMESYMSLGVPSQLVRERILAPSVAAAFGKDGRARIADVLDYVHEVVDAERSLRSTRRQLFAAIEALNATLAAKGFAYYAYGTFRWDDDFKRVQRVSLDAFAITRVKRYRVATAPRPGPHPNERWIRALHVTRLDGGDLAGHQLGFTAPDYDDVLVLPAKVDEELARGLVPALDPGAFTPLFHVSAADRRAAWYRTLRQRIAAVLREDFAAISGARPAPKASPNTSPSWGFHASWTRIASLARGWDRAALREAMLTSVEVHETQHQIDFDRARAIYESSTPKRPPPLFGPFRHLADEIEDERAARSCLYETSAHLAQMARDELTPRLVATVIASFAFTDRCDDGDCLAALVILDELARQLVHGDEPRLAAAATYQLADVAARYVAITAHSRAEVQAAARAAWARLWPGPLASIEPPPDAGSGGSKSLPLHVVSSEPD